MRKLLLWSSLQGSAFRVAVAFLIFFVAFPAAYLLLMLPSSFETPALFWQQTTARGMAAAFWIVAQWCGARALLATGIAHGLRAGQLEDVIIYLKSFRDKEPSPTQVLKALTVRGRPLLEYVIKRGSLDHRLVDAVLTLASQESKFGKSKMKGRPGRRAPGSGGSAKEAKS